MIPPILTIVAGTNRPIPFMVNSTLVPLSANFNLSVVWGTGRREYTEGNGVSKSQTGDTVEIVWSYSVADTRAFPVGKLVKLSLQWIQGGIQGADEVDVLVLQGVNTD